MKKTTASRTPLLLFLLVSGGILLAILLASCEPQSLIGAWNTDGADTVLLPLDTSAATAPTATTTPVTEALSAPPVTGTEIIPITTAPPVTAPIAPPVYHPLTGHTTNSATALARPFAFCVKRASAATVASADIVIEAPTEAAFTRFSLLGCGNVPIYKEADIASTRPYIAALSHDFFGISVYRGTSDNGHPATDFLYDTIDLEACGRLTDLEKLQRYAIESGYQTSITGTLTLPFRFPDIKESVLPSQSSASYASVAFPEGALTTFTYDAVRKSYTMRSSAALVADGDPLPTFSNILVLFHDATRRITKDGTELSLDTALGGQGFLLSNGGVMPIFWRRDPVTSALLFTDTDGIALTVNRGKTYIGMTTYEEKDSLIMN